jgi:hypothetical protein
MLPSHPLFGFSRKYTSLNFSSITQKPKYPEINCATFSNAQSVLVLISDWLRAERPGSITAVGRDFSLRNQIGPGAHTAFYPMDTGGPFTGDKAAGT